MSELMIDTGRIASTGSAVVDIGGALATEISTMRDLLGQIRLGWQSSEAAPRFAAAMEANLADATSLKDALIGHGSALGAAAQRFGETESGLAQMIPAVG